MKKHLMEKLFIFLEKYFFVKNKQKTTMLPKFPCIVAYLHKKITIILLVILKERTVPRGRLLTTILRVSTVDGKTQIEQLTL